MSVPTAIGRGHRQMEKVWQSLSPDRDRYRTIAPMRFGQAAGNKIPAAVPQAGCCYTS
jgi:hypothetical protein